MRPPLRRLLTGLCLVTLSSLGGCGIPGAAPDDTRPAARSTATPRQGGAAAVATRVGHVVAVSVDGLNPDALELLGPEELPNYHRLMDEGASTLDARTEVESTSTLPNHTGMFTGLRVDAARGGHGVTFNSDEGGTVREAAGRTVPSVFDAVHAAGGRTALVTGKDKFRVFDRSWPDGIDAFFLATDPALLVRRTAAELRRNDPMFLMLHLRDPDLAGHDHGFMGREYLDAVRRTDAMLGEVLAVLESDPELQGDTLLVLTADHGGMHSHRNPLDPANYTVPFMAWGPGVAGGADLYALNPQLADPGDARVGYHAAGQPVRNGYVANLVTTALGLPPVQGSQLDRDQTFTVW